MGEHWYKRDGSSAYTTDGRDTTLRDARRHGYVPSVTTVLGVLHKDALVKWKEEQVAKAAYKYATNEGVWIDAMSVDQFVADVLSKARQFPIDAANEGTRIHDACETYVRDGKCRPEYLPHAEAAYAELRKLFPDVDDWVCEKSFAHPLGFGGKVDLHSPSTRIVPDYKTKDGDFSDGKRLGWDQNWQLAAYQVGLGLAHPKRPETFAPGAAIFISRTHPGKVASYVWTAEQMYQGWQVFAAALQIHKLLKGYDASW